MLLNDLYWIVESPSQNTAFFKQMFLWYYVESELGVLLSLKIFKTMGAKTRGS